MLFTFISQIGTHDFLGMQIVPLKVLIPHETKELTLDLVKNTNPYDPVNKKGRGHLIVELTYNPFIDDHGNYSGPLDGKVVGEKSHQSKSRKGSIDFSCFSSLEAAGLLSVTVQGAEDVSGKNRSNPNPYALVSFGEETKITKVSILALLNTLFILDYVGNCYLHQLKGDVLLTYCRFQPYIQVNIHLNDVEIDSQTT